MALLVAAAMLWGCSAQKEAADTYETYQGYACQDGSGHIKYGLETENGIRLHCFFQSGSPEYTEDIYELKLSPGEGEKASVEQVIDGQGVDLTASFRKFDFSFYPDRVVMEVERDMDLLAGGASDNLETGEHSGRRKTGGDRQSGTLAGQGACGYEPGVLSEGDEFPCARDRMHR